MGFATLNPSYGLDPSYGLAGLASWPIVFP
jgi:hypothetical protein